MAEASETVPASHGAEVCVVAAGMIAQHLEGFVDRDAALRGNHALGLLDDDATVERLSQLLVDPPLLVQL